MLFLRLGHKKVCFFCVGESLALCFLALRKASCMSWIGLRQGLCAKEQISPNDLETCGLPTVTGVSLEREPLLIEPWEDCHPGWQCDYNLMMSLDQRHLVKMHLDSWSSETVREYVGCLECLTTLNFKVPETTESGVTSGVLLSRILKMW